MNRKEIRENAGAIFALALPIIIENILQTLLGTTDTYFAGQLTDNAIAGISITSLVMNIFISFFTAVSVGTTAVVSRNFGKKDYDQVNRSISHSLILGTVLGLTTGIICLVFCRPILKLSGANQEIIAYAVPYYMVVAVPSVLLCLQLILSSCLRAIKDTKTPMYVTGFSNILNILFNYLFMNAGLGIFGLGLATSLSRAISALFLFIRLKKHDQNIHISVMGSRFDKAIISSILKVGIPAGIEKLIMRIGQLIYNGMIISIGTAAYVSHNVAGNIESYSYIPALGFGLAAATFVGTSLGEGNPKKAVKMTFTAYCIAACFMVLIGCTFYILAPQLAALFTDTKEVQVTVVSVLRLIAFFQPFSALTQVLTSALQGAGDTKFPMYSTFMGIWGIRICVGYTLAARFGLGLTGVWTAYAMDLTLRGFLLLWRFKGGKWQGIKI